MTPVNDNRQASPYADYVEAAVLWAVAAFLAGVLGMMVW